MVPKAGCVPQPTNEYCTLLISSYDYLMQESYNGTLLSRRAPPHLPIVDRGNRPNIIYLTVCTESPTDAR
jgi:hypothetical protein